MKSIVKRIVPKPIRGFFWRLYGYIRENWLRTILGSANGEKVIAITFDDGPDPKSYRQILELLDQNNAKATFFMLGQHICDYPEAAQAIARAGHEIGNHTFSHPHLTLQGRWLVWNELRNCEKEIQKITAVRTKFFRPPYGEQSPLTYIIARLLGYRVVHWSVDAQDWQGDSPELIIQRIKAGLAPGAILLVHDGLILAAGEPENGREPEIVKSRAPTIEALTLLLPQLKAQGYRFVSLPELVRMKPLKMGTWFEGW
jgi:peptidoglycan-N-acetylglucosamine deacetylase